MNPLAKRHSSTCSADLQCSLLYFELQGALLPFLQVGVKFLQLSWIQKRINYIFNTMEIIIFSRSQSIILNSVPSSSEKNDSNPWCIAFVILKRKCPLVQQTMKQSAWWRFIALFWVCASIYITQNNSNDNNNTNMHSYYFGGASFLENIFIVDVSFSPYNSPLNWEVMIIMSILWIQMAREV